MSDSNDPLVQIRLSDLLSLQAAVGMQRSEAPVNIVARSAAAPPVAAATAEYLNTREAAALLGVSTKCLEAWRAKGEGPPFAHVGRAVRYPTAELRAWVVSSPAHPATRPGIKAAAAAVRPAAQPRSARR